MNLCFFCRHSKETTDSSIKDSSIKDSGASQLNLYTQLNPSLIQNNALFVCSY